MRGAILLATAAAALGAGLLSGIDASSAQTGPMPGATRSSTLADTTANVRQARRGAARPVRTAIGCTRPPGRRFGVRGFPAQPPTQNACGPSRRR